MLPGISGALSPLRYLANPVAREAARVVEVDRATRTHAKLAGWWSHVAAACGPATGMRALFDLVAMPLAAMLGFKATGAVFDRDRTSVRLTTPSGAAVRVASAPLGDAHPTCGATRSRVAARAGASWCFVVAPPFVSLLHVRGQAARRSVDFSFPEVIHPSSIGPMLMLCHASAFNTRPAAPAAVDRLLTAAAAFQDRVREDLQAGVMTALASLTAPGVLAPHATSERFDEALTIIYRVLFLLFAAEIAEPGTASAPCLPTHVHRRRPDAAGALGQEQRRLWDEWPPSHVSPGPAAAWAT